LSRAEVEDTYAEAFRSVYAEFLITARDRTWLDHALNAATGNASSTILCDCEAGLDRYVGPGGDESFATPDGRPGAIVQLHVPRFRKDRVEALERSLLVRISQNVLTCATAACFSLLDTEPYYKLGRKIAYFGDGYQFRDMRHGRRVWVIPILSGEFVVERRFGYRDGLMGGTPVVHWDERIPRTPDDERRCRDAPEFRREVVAHHAPSAWQRLTLTQWPGLWSNLEPLIQGAILHAASYYD
jgi:formylmethanofuran--tetrahydromethanopterin N-formyltransferase